MTTIETKNQRVVLIHEMEIDRKTHAQTHRNLSSRLGYQMYLRMLKLA